MMGNQFSDEAEVLVGVKEPLPFLPTWMLSEILSVNTEIPKNASLLCFC